MGTYLIERICNLFLNNLDHLKQLKKNNNQDIKSILLLLLPYINDDKVDVYLKLKDLNELILTQQLIPSDYEQDREKLLNTHFKYTNIGIGLIDKNNKIELKNDIYGKLIYRLLYHNFIALNQTLSIINGKLYVNWLNIYPLTEENYKDSMIYKNTENNLYTAIRNINDDNIYDYNGLYIGEFYNVFRNVYFEGIKNIKWFIFIIKDKYLINYLNDLFNFDLLFEFNSFDDLPIKDKDIFTNTLKNHYNKTYELLWKNVFLFFINNYSLRNIALADSGIDEITINKFSLANKNKITFSSITDDDLILCLNQIEPKYIWNYLKESLILFQLTIYSTYLIKDNKITSFLKFPNTELNLKNVYNIAKSLSHFSIDNWTLLPTKYSSLNIDQIDQFWDKFKDPKNNYSNWIDLTNNLALEKGQKIDLFEYDNIMQKKLDDFNKIKTELIWNYLIKNGILSEFQTNFKINDSREYGQNRIKTIHSFFKDKDKIKKYENAYYYLTNKKYKDHKFRLDKETTKETSLLKNLENSDFKWYTFFAMDWISQIGFYHHYLNHRVLYITGATGQGKSTQVPKLFMYSLKMLDYKMNGKVICTQPRIGPTNSNANRISEELGVPIEQYSYSLKDKVKDDNYYVQLSHSSDKHNKKSCNHLTLKLLTDGTLLEEIIKNPFLKEEIPTNINNKKDVKYSNTNKYDIIIIDEAHEHNTNMDLILTLARHSCFINNDLKLVIMSATMDDDEPNFRSYYNIINDNLVYPLRNKIPIYFSNLQGEFLYDSIYLDRRFHIAPPGIATQYNITEYYEPNGETNRIVKNILESSIAGDILIFENGTNEITKRIESLNAVIPNNVIALPYYSKLNNKYKVFIEMDLEKNIKGLKINKNNVKNYWGEKYIESNDVPENTYNRCIIVATNVAEASLTLPNLKYVIDNGYSKVNSYNYVEDLSNLIAEEISDASRKQRKGRVGRVSSGTIYYLYEKGAREKNKPKYKITQENFGYNLIKLLETKTTFTKSNELLQTHLYDPNIYNTFDKILSINNIENSIFYKKNIYNIIKNQYTYNGSYDQYWNYDYYDHMSTNKLEYMYKNESGFNLNLLVDKFGLFYIIHPFEHLLKRNIKGEIISYKLDDNSNDIIKNKLSDKIFTNMLLNLNNKYLLVDFKLASLSFININDINFSDYAKTEFVTFINDLDQYLDWKEKSIEDIIIMLTSKAYGSFNEVLEILTFIKTINNKMNNIFIKFNINNYNYQDIEIEYIYNLISDFKKSFNYFKVFEIKNYKNLENKYKNDAVLIVNDFLVDYEKNKLDCPKNKYSVNLWNKLSSSYHNGTLKSKEGFMKFVKYMPSLNDEIYNFRNYINEIKLWANNRNINYEIIMEFLENYTKILLDVLTIKKDFDPEINELDPLEKMELESTSFKKSLTYNNNLEHIIRPFLHGNPYNIALKLNTNGSYKTIPPVNVINSSKPNNTKLLLYYNKEPSEDTDYKYNINITNKIEIEWLFNAAPFYYKPAYFKNEIVKVSTDGYKIYELYGNLFNDFSVSLSNKLSLHNIPFESTELPILKEYIKNLKNSVKFAK